MSRRRRRIVKSFIAALGVAVAVGPNAAAQPLRDLPSPDAPYAAAASVTAPSQDLRSPDARDAATAAAAETRRVAKWTAFDNAVSSLTPAERTIALGGGPANARAAAGHAPAPAGTSHATGTDWTRVAITSGGVLAAMLVVFGGMFLVTRHPASRTRVVSS